MSNAIREALKKELHQNLQKFGTVKTEYKFHETRKFRFDYYIEELKLGIEVNGGVFAGGFGGRHNRGAGYIKDLEKLNLAQVNGYRVLQYTYDDLKKLKYMDDVKEFKKNVL